MSRPPERRAVENARECDPSLGPQKQFCSETSSSYNSCEDTEPKNAMSQDAQPPQIAELEALIKNEAKAISDKIAQEIQSAGSEEDVRHLCNKLIDGFIEKAKLNISGRHEYEIDGGFLDSKYSRVLLEYKYPHGQSRIAEGLDSPGTKKVIKQLQSRFVAFKKTEKRSYETLLGVGLDGVNVLTAVRFNSHGLAASGCRVIV